MRVSFDLPQMRVVESHDTKGNPVAYLEILGAKVLYANEETLRSIGEDGWEEVFRYRLGRALADILLGYGGLDGWSKDSPTGREVHTVGMDETD